MLVTSVRPLALSHRVARASAPLTFHTLRSLRRCYATGLPQHTDVLEQYLALVRLGRVRQDDDQIRVLMQVWTPCARLSSGALMADSSGGWAASS
jgi:hypothetical protein